MNLFFHAGAFSAGADVILPAEESQHLCKVLRMKNGEAVRLFDGKGNGAEGEIVAANPKGTHVRITGLLSPIGQPPRVTLAFALPKGQALDFMIRHCAELGVRAFQPLETRHSLRGKEFNRDRWERVLLEVCKQSQNFRLAELPPPLTMEKWLASRSPADRLIFCSETDRQAKLECTSADVKVDLVIGSEGGWANDELESLKNSNALSLGLGVNRLRMETAALAALVLVKKLVGEL